MSNQHRGPAGEHPQRSDRDERLTGQDAASAARQERPSAVATVHASAHRVPAWVRAAGAGGVVETAEAGPGWSLLTAQDYADLLAVVEASGAPGTLLDAAEGHRALTVLRPDGQAVVLEWEAPAPDRDSAEAPSAPAGAENAAQERAEARRQAGVAALTGLFGLDQANARRLDRYVRDTGRYAPESVLQLLGVPDVSAKIIDGRRTFSEQPGHRRVLPPAPGASGTTETGPGPAAGPTARSRRRTWAGAAAAAGLGLGLGGWLLRRRP